MTLFPAYTRRKPRFCALAQAILSQAKDLENTIREIPAAYSPEGAGGVRLDALGSASGLPRPEGMADEDYRKYLLAKFALFTWNGTNETTQPLLESIFPGSTLSDNGDGTVTVHPVSPMQEAYRLWPVPSGVSVRRQP
jgi:hypothetical protein